jgi:hypothetical protein
MLWDYIEESNYLLVVNGVHYGRNIRKSLPPHPNPTGGRGGVIRFYFINPKTFNKNSRAF